MAYTYEYCPADPVWYATDLRLDLARGLLQWTGGRGQDALLVRSPYGTDAESLMESLCGPEGPLGRTELRAGRFTELVSYTTGAEPPSHTARRETSWTMRTGTPSHTAVRLVTALEKARHNGCPLDGEARTYTVFACQTVGDTRRIYGHQRGEISSPRCDVPMRLRLDVEAVAVRRGLFSLHGQEGGYYRLSFPPVCPESYRDGDLLYQVGGFSVPITRRMFEAGAVYVQADIRPRLVSRIPGLVQEGG